MYMLENKWVREYLKGLFETSGKGLRDVERLVDSCGINDLEHPFLEIGFLRQSEQVVGCFNLAVAQLALCREAESESLLADLFETVEYCNGKILKAKEELPMLLEQVAEDPNNGEKLARLGFGLNTLDDREAALKAFTNALEHPESLSLCYHRDCLNNIGWDHYLRGEYEQAIGWFEHACRLKQPPMQDDDENGPDSANEDEPAVPYQLALENILLTLAKMGQLTQASARLQEYHR